MPSRRSSSLSPPGRRQVRTEAGAPAALRFCPRRRRVRLRRTSSVSLPRGLLRSCRTPEPLIQSDRRLGKSDKQGSGRAGGDGAAAAVCPTRPAGCWREAIWGVRRGSQVLGRPLRHRRSLETGPAGLGGEGKGAGQRPPPRRSGRRPAEAARPSLPRGGRAVSGGSRAPAPSQEVSGRGAGRWGTEAPGRQRRLALLPGPPDAAVSRP